MLDLCLLCVKSYDLPQTLADAGKVITATTIVIPLLNGIDIYERIRAVVTRGTVLPATVYVGTHIERPGKVVQKGGSCRILFGNDPNNRQFDPAEVRGLLSRNNIQSQWLDDPYPEIWKKFIFIAPFGLVTACFDVTLGQVFESEKLQDHVVGIMREIVALSEKKGVSLPPAIIEDSLRTGKSFSYETKTSFQRDFEKPGKPDERDIFGASIIQLGTVHGVNTPVTQFILQELHKKKQQIVTQRA